MNKLERYELARNCIVDYTDGDVTAAVLREYAVSGMYNILSCLHSLGISGENSKLFALPDFTFSRNDNRYQAGFPYGSIIHIDTKNTPFIPLGFRPNCCGITMVEFSNKENSLEKIRARIRNLGDLDTDIASDDLSRGNHFVGIYYDSQIDKSFGIIHGSFSFVKSGYRDIPGLYIDKTNYWNNKLKVFDNAEISFPYLIDEAAKEYYKAYIQHEDHTKTLRAQVANHLFPDSTLLFNETHEGMFAQNTIVLGSYTASRSYSSPILLAAEADLPILQITTPLPYLSDSIYACPHGGGYSLQHIEDGKFDIHNRLYHLRFRNGACMETDDVRKLIYDYRLNTDKIWADNLGFGIVQKRLKTIYNFKL